MSFETYLRVGIDASGSTAGANVHKAATDKIVSASDKAAEAQRKFEGQVKAAKVALIAFGTAALYSAVRTISEFQTSLAAAGAVTRATAADMVRLESITRKLGATTEFSAAQAAEGAKFLGMAGFRTNEIMAALPVTLDLATVAQMDLGQAADITSNIMSGFSLQASEASKAADVLAAISTSANTDVSGMGQAMKYVGPIAKSLGISMEDTAAAVGVLANQGIQGSMAGASLKTSLSALLSTAKPVVASVKSLGLTMEQVNPQAHSLSEIVKTLADAGLDAERAFAIFGQRGATAMLALTGNVPELEKLTTITNTATGTLDRMAKIMRDTLGQNVKEFTSALSELALAIGDSGLTGTVRSYIQEATKWVSSLSESLSAINKNREQAQLLADTLNVVKNAVIALMVLKLADWLFVAGNAMRALNLAMSANPYVLLAAGLLTLAGHLKDLQGETDRLTEYTDLQTKALEQMGNSGVVAANRVRVSFLEAQKQAIGSLAEINREIESMNAAERQREDARKRAYDPFGAKQQMAGANDPGTFNALLETQQNRDMAILLKKKAAIEEIDKKIAGLNQTIKVYGQVSDTNFMKAQRASERMLGIAGGFIGGKVEGAAIVPDKNTGDTVAGMGMAQEEKNAREKPLYDNDGMMSLAFQQMGILKQESDKIIEVMKNQESAKQKYMEGLTKQALAEEKRLELTKTYKGDIAEVDTQMQLYNATREHGLTIGDTEYKLIEQQIRAQKEAANGIIKLEEARKKELEQTKRAEEAHKQWAQSMTYAFKDAIMNSKNLGDALSNLANKVQNMLVNKALDSLLGGLFSGFAKGDVFSGGRNMAFAAGGVVSRATTFPMSNGGMGLMGEAGPEAIMPLTRTSSGALGVQAVGGNSGGLSIVNQFEINIEGGDKEQNEDAANQVSSAILRIIDDKIVNVILREKRPGGALS